MKQTILSNLIALMIVAAVFLAGILLVSCSKENTGPSHVKNNLKELEFTPCNSMEFTIWAGQNIEAGILTVSNDATNLKITYLITDPSQAMTEIHLWAGWDIDECPATTPGNPKVGQFPYFANSTTSVPAGNLLTDPTEYSLTIPLSTLEPQVGSTIYVAAHAVSASQTMWGEATPFNGNSWATYSEYPYCGSSK